MTTLDLDTVKRANLALETVQRALGVEPFDGTKARWRGKHAARDARVVRRVWLYALRPSIGLLDLETITTLNRKTICRDLDAIRTLRGRNAALGDMIDCVCDLVDAVIATAAGAKDFFYEAHEEAAALTRERRLEGAKRKPVLPSPYKSEVDAIMARAAQGRVEVQRRIDMAVVANEDNTPQARRSAALRLAAA